MFICVFGFGVAWASCFLVWGVVSLVYVGFFVVDYCQFAVFWVVMYNGIACCEVVWFDLC